MAFTILVLFLSLIVTLILSPPQALLYLLAVFPVFILLILFYVLDYRSTLPIVIAFESFWFGALVSLPIGFGLEVLFLDHVWPLSKPASPGSPVMGLHIFYSFLRCLLIVALIEEAVKLCVAIRLRPATRTDPAEFDDDEKSAFLSIQRRLAHPYGVVLGSVCTAAGFAAVENIAYVVFAEKLLIGVQTAILRAIVSVPGHMAFSALAATFIAEWKFHRELYARGLAPKEPYHGATMTFFGLGASVILHGTFDWVLSCVNILEKHKVSTATNLIALAGLITVGLVALAFFVFVLASRSLRRFADMPIVHVDTREDGSDVEGDDGGEGEGDDDATTAKGLVKGVAIVSDGNGTNTESDNGADRKSSTRRRGQGSSSSSSSSSTSSSSSSSSSASSTVSFDAPPLSPTAGPAFSSSSAVFTAEDGPDPEVGLPKETDSLISRS